MEGEVTVERITEKKIIKPAPPTQELYDMIERFRGLDKEAMIKLYNSPNCAPSWTPHERRVAKNAMLMHLKGTAPAPQIKRTMTDELEDEIRKDQIRNRPKSQIELDIEQELSKVHVPPVTQNLPPQQVEESLPPEIPVFEVESDSQETKAVAAPEKEIPSAKSDELPIGEVKVIKRKETERPLRERIPRNLKK